MRSFAVCSLLCVCLSVLAVAEDPGPRYDYMKIYDVSPHELMARYGRLPGQYLFTDDLEDECPSYWCYYGDTLKMLAILIEWDDRPSTYPPDSMHDRLFSRNSWSSGSVADYIAEVSYGDLTLTGAVEGWFNAGDYAVYPSMTYWDSIVAALDPFIDYSQYDGNSDGCVDAICFLLAGNSKTESGGANDPQPIAWTVHPDNAAGPFDGVMATRFHISCETSPIRDPEDLFQFTGEDTVGYIVTECHELGHNIGLPDLYDYDSHNKAFYTPDDANDFPMVDWCVMDGAQRGNAFEIAMPAHPCGWTRMKIGWIEPITLSGQFEDLVIYNIETHTDSALYLLPITPEEGEYFILEYRNPVSSHQFGKYAADFSRAFYPDLDFGEELLDRGLLITHVHDSLFSAFWVVMNDGLPTFPHYAVAVEDAGYDPARDYTYNPEGRVTDSAQWWCPYESRLGACFSSDVPGQSEFGPTTVPSSDGYFGPSDIYVRVDSIVGDRLYMYVNNSGSASYVCGDADGDGEVTQADVAFLIEYLHKDGPAPEPMEAGDANGDGTVDKYDAKYLIEYLHKDGPEPICP